MAAVKLWGTLLTGVMSSGKSLTGSSAAGEVYSTEFSIHQVSYYFMVWSSLTLGGIMVIEQYFGRRIFCFMPANNTQPAAAIGEYCWQHGQFEKAQSDMTFYLEDEKWILNSFVYFFIRSAVFVVPHLIWQFKYEAWIVAIIKSSMGLIKELQVLWLQFSEVADKAYSDHNDTTPIEEPRSMQQGSTRQNQGHLYQNIGYQPSPSPGGSRQPQGQTQFNHTSSPMSGGSRETNHHTNSHNQHGVTGQLQPPLDNNNSEAIRKHRLYKAYNAVLAMTRDVVQITKKQVPHYSGITYFIMARMLYDILVILIFTVMDIMILRICHKYDSTDYYCNLPGNVEQIRCMMPMMSFQWYAAFLSTLTSGFMLILTVINTIRLTILLCSPSTKGTFLDHIPLADVAADTTWQSCSDRKTYKLLSKFLQQNLCIISPLNFMESFVDHMKENHEVGEDLLSKTEREGIQMVEMRQIIGYNNGDDTDGDDALWRLMATK